MRLPRTGVYALIAVLVAGIIGGNLANGAAKKRVKTRVTISFQGTDYGDSFSGKVKPKAKGKIKRKCRKGRKVTVLRKRAGGNERIGTDKSNRRGRWVVGVGGLADPGRYFAKAKKKKIRFRGDEIVCKRGRSKKITVS